MTSTRARSRAVFIDRDGTIMHDADYCSDPKQVQIFEGAGTALSRLKNAGYKIIVITNQSGIGRGFFTEKQYRAVEAEVSRQLGDKLIDAVVGKLRSDRKIDIVTAAHPFENAAEASSPHQVKVIVDLDGNALYFSRYAIPFPRNRSLPIKYLRHPGIYGFRRKALLDFVKWKPTPLERAESLEQLRALENGVKVHVLVTKHGSPGVDTLADAKALEQKLARANRGVSR